VGEAEAVVAAAWAAVAAGRGAGAATDGALAARWAALLAAVDTGLQPMPLRAGACARPHDCIGVDVHGHCVCY
jgi:hypothetical protein